jgi:hypothetical protein
LASRQRAIASEADVLAVIALLRLNYDRAIATHGVPRHPEAQIEQSVACSANIFAELLTKHCPLRHSCADAARRIRLA